MTGGMGWCLAYLLNSLWQVPLIYLAAKLLVRLGRRGGPAFLHRVWVAALVLETVLPAVPHPSALLLRSLAQRLWTFGGRNFSATNGQVQIDFDAGLASGFYVPVTPWFGVLLGLALAVTAYFTARLLWHLWRLRDLRLHLGHTPVPETLARRWERHCRQAGIRHARLALATAVRGPATIGLWRPLVLFPVTFATAASPEDQDAALAHECAHLQRHDFARNLAYEILSLPVACHPLRHRTLAELAASREIVCDALAAAAVAGPARYARSLLRLAAAVLATAPADNPHAIGLYDAHTLERRIMTLTRKHPRPSRAHRAVLAAATLILPVAACTSATALHLGIAAQPAPGLQEGTGTSISSSVMAGNILTRVNPIYPPDARAAHISGSVLLKAHIDKGGNIQDLSVVSGPPELQQSALDAVHQWTYRPYLLNGQPTDVVTTIHVNYQLAK